ncbi:xylose isomerase domain-containing protein [Caballeronia arationis]|jgi:sugar phosphate isomerase/epimerase|uniref:Sugar phosphate isomerase/epimerase n=1 Tax=Caballeronia arationis TaxID=1777142 RepID=A0A7Z7I4I2_9BURK|nr:sugar phosphate isomerase/epimerase [Caballeronia arationis]SAK47585.1 xylose isomerase domain-containing protein [Caballeronia arationis]SOE59501.1 Sugar phosphate isomerase/epimerase [Caballeronia arationis]
MSKENLRPLSLSALTVLELTPPQMVECAAQAGYDFVGLRLLPATDHEVRHDIVGDTPLKRETLARLKDTGIRVLDAEILRLKPDTDVRAYEPMMQTAAELGARYLLVAGNDPDEARTANRLAQLCELAAPLGLTPSLEPMPWTDAKDIVRAARIVKASGAKNTGLIVDPLHFDRAGSSTDELRALPREWFGYVQFCDAPAERPKDLETLLYQARCERMIPGEGGLDLAGILRALPDGVPVSIEVPMERWAKTAKAVERAKKLREATLAVLDKAYALS